MSAMPGFGLTLPPINTNAHADDVGSPSALNTPVNVVAGNYGANPVQILDALAEVGRVQNGPALQALAGGAGGGGLPSWVWIAAAALAVVLVLRGKS